MQTAKTNSLFSAAALIFIIGALLIAATAKAYAAEPPAGAADVSAPTLTVKEVWLTGETLHVSVTDSAGELQTLELNLREYAKTADEYVTVQATDSDGRTSNSVSFKNPYYAASVGQPGESGGEAFETPAASSEAAVPDGGKLGGGGRPFTPDGTGSVADNATDGDGKEFFTVKTADGNVFYLIVDRQRTSDNVYLLNAVNEDDLVSLAKPGSGKSESVISSAANPPAVTAAPMATPEPMPTPEPAKSGGNAGTLALVVIAALIFGGAVYYFKIVRPKKTAAYETDYREADEDAEYDLEADAGEEDKTE